MNQPQARLNALTGIRFVAALLIVLTHFGAPAVAAICGTGAFGRLAVRATVSGYVGVNMFFLLSGFILAYTYLAPDGQLRGTVARFYRARFARIYPVYAVAMLVSVLTVVAWHDFDGDRFRHAYDAHPLVAVLAAFTLLQDWSSNLSMLFDPPAWSLSAEAAFYALFPFAGVALARLPIQRLTFAIAALWLVGLVPGVIAAHTGIPLRLYPLQRVPEFLIGVCLGRLFVLGYLPRVRAWPGAVLSLGTVLLAASLPVFLVDAGLLDFPFLLLLTYLAQGHGRVARTLASAPFLLLGEASYSLYLLHWPLWTLATHVVPPPTGSPAVALYFAVYVAAAIGCSILMLRLVELPARTWLRRPRRASLPAVGIA